MPDPAVGYRRPKDQTITRALGQKLYLGNLDAKRDRGHARGYVRVMWLMLQHSQPDEVPLIGKCRQAREHLADLVRTMVEADH